MESSICRDLSGVRVHTGDAAAQQADAVNARAFTTGQDIFFAKGQYKPDTPEGDALIAHEVAHTAQQGGAAEPDGALQTTTPGDRAEQNADQAAAAMLEGRPAAVSSEPRAIARKRTDEPIEVPASITPSGEQAPAGAAQREGQDENEQGEEIGGELSVQRVGQSEDDDGDEPIGPPQNTEAGKASIAEAGAALPAQGAEDVATTAPPMGDAASAADSGQDVELSAELQASVGAAQADAVAAAEEAKGEANAYQAELRDRRDRFDDEQQALTLEQLTSMSPADKRSTLVEMGYDKKAVKKMKDAELDGIISGKLEQEQRKTKILGMDPDELAALTPAQKIQYLVDLGIPKKDLDKIGEAKAVRAFDDVLRVAHVPGKHKVKIKIKGGLAGKSWEVSVNVDAEGNTDVEAKKKGGFLSKLWGWVKAALPIILTVLAPLTGGASLIVLAVYQTVSAIASGDWLGAVVGIAGAFVGVGALAAVKNGASAAANAFKNIADVAGKVKKVADSAKAAMVAAKAKNAGSLLSALATGASSFASFASASAAKFQETMLRWSERLEKWSGVVSGGERVIAGIKTGDPIAAIGGAFDTAAAFTSKVDADGKETSKRSNDFQRYSRIAGYASAGQRAIKGSPPDYGSVVEAALGIAGELKGGKRLEDASRITAAASRLSRAIQTNNPAELAAAALALAETLQLAKYDASNPEGTGAEGDPSNDREKIVDRYAKATSVVRFAGAAAAAASARPRADYAAALEATTLLIADLTESRKLDQVAVLSQRFNAWTQAVKSKNEAAIIAAVIEFGKAVNEMRGIFIEERDAAKKAAEAHLAPGETLGDDGGVIPSVPVDIEDVGGELASPVEAASPDAEEGRKEAGTEETGGGAAATEGSTQKPADPNAGRRSTPDGNYTVFSGDSLSRISVAFNIKLAELRRLNPQLVEDRIYVGQKLFVPGADVVPSGTVTTEESYRVDPEAEGQLAQLEAERQQLLVRTYRIIRTWNAQIVDWNKERSLGADFYVYVREFKQAVDGFDRMVDRPTTSIEAIKAGIQSTNAHFQRVMSLYHSRNGQNQMLINVGLVAATVVRDGAGMVLNVLDRSRISPAIYQTVVTAIDEAFVKNGGGGQAVLRGAIAGALTAIPGPRTETVLNVAITEGFRELGMQVNDMMADLNRNGGMMTREERRNLQAQYLVKIPTIALGGAVKGRLDVLNDAAQASNITKLFGEVLYEGFKRATDRVIQ